MILPRDDLFLIFQNEDNISRQCEISEAIFYTNSMEKILKEQRLNN